MRQVSFAKQIWIWIRRFRYRRGYGVHSPFAFQLLTWVVYERSPYYAYAELEPLRAHYDRRLLNSRKVDKLLFRLANAVQPVSILDWGSPTPLSASYLQAGCRSAVMLTSEQMFDGSLGLLYWGSREPDYETIDRLLACVDNRSLFIIDGIYASTAMKEWWTSLKNDPRTGISFDLYDVGLLFFDKTKIKQHYLVNF